MRLISLSIAAALLVLAPAAPAHAQFGGPEATAVREDFSLPAGPVHILVFRPEVRVGSQTTGGMNEPNVEWTETAKANILAALQKEQRARGTSLVIVPELEGEQAKLVADYTALFRTVAEAAFQHKMFPGNRLPSKREEFDWTLGDEAARLKALGGEYGLFLFTYDSYGSTGRKVLQVLALGLGAGFVPSGVHIGYAGLVDLDNGDLVWLNADTSMGGDPREAEGAAKRVAQLLEGFPLKGEGNVTVEPQPQPDPNGNATIELPGTGAVDEPEDSQ
jgi:hypothetical protein